MSLFSKCTFIVVAVLVASLPAFALTGYRYDDENTGYVADDALKQPLSLLWKHSTDLVKDPIIAGGGHDPPPRRRWQARFVSVGGPSSSGSNSRACRSIVVSFRVFRVFRGCLLAKCLPDGG